MFAIWPSLVHLFSIFNDFVTVYSHKRGVKLKTLYTFTINYGLSKNRHVLFLEM